MAVVFIAITILAVASLVLPFALRTSRLMWVVIVCGGVLAMSSSRIAISVDADGVVAGSAQPGMLMMIMGFLACVCLVAGGAVKRFRPLHSSSGEQTTETRLHPLIVFGRAVLAVLLAVCIGIQCWYGLVRHQDEGLNVSGSGLPMVVTDYLESGADHRVLAVSAQTRNTVNYTVMRTSRGDLIDSSPVERVRLLDGKHDDVDQVLAKACATLLSNPDEQAIADTVPYEQLSTNIAASDGTQSLVSTDAGSYYRLTLQNADAQNVDTSWQQRTQQSAWRYAWLICLSVILVLYCLVAVPRRRLLAGLEVEA